MNMLPGLKMVPSLDGSSSKASSSSAPRSRLTPRRSRDVDNCSLPLKKRRFLQSQIMSFQDQQADAEADAVQPETVIPSSPPAVFSRQVSLSLQYPSFDKTEDEKMAALALISASSVVHSSSFPPDSPIPVSRPVQTVLDEDPLSAAIAITCLATPRSSQDMHSSTLGTTLGRFVTQGSTTAAVNTVSPLPVKPVPLQCHPADESTASSLSMTSSSEEENGEYHAAEEEDIMSGNEEDESVSPHSHLALLLGPNSQPSKNNGRLTRPFPNGCHGKTSRYNSYCRRLPCFNGSNFCKLHYSLYENNKKTTLAEEENPATSTVTAPAVVVSTTKKSRVVTANLPLLQAALHAAAAAKSTNAQQQDKRFTGSQGEIRCQATTTRGRACAYVAAGDANNNKYCHLHADYDKNPPARRNKAALIASTTSLMQKGSKVFVVGKHAKTAHGSEAEGKEDLHESTAQSFPLLSMLSTDVWFDKRVIISTGPFMNRTGHVLRWGNGWVTVKLDVESGSDSGSSRGKVDDIVHNRRSFELFLHPDQTLETPGKEGL